MVNPVTNENGEHFGGTFGFLKSLKYAISSINPTDVIIVCDGPNAGLRRRLESKEYKANRQREWKRGIVGSYDFLSEEEQKDSFNRQMHRINEYLTVLPVKTITVPYVEADDIIAEISNNTNDNEVVIYSTDGDFKQLISDSVYCYNPMKKELITEQKFFEKHGFIAKNFIYFKTIVGDKSDGLVGVNGIGEKTFLKLFPIAEKEIIGSLDDLFSYSELVLNSKSKDYSKAIKEKHKKILENRELITKNYSLMQLLDVNISSQTKDVVHYLMTERKSNQFNKIKLRTMFISDKLQTQVKNFDEWSRVFSGIQR